MKRKRSFRSLDFNPLYDLVLERRKRKRELSTQIENPASQLAEVDIFELCQTYDDEGYGEMDEDVVRNAAYLRAIKSVFPILSCACLTSQVEGCSGNCLLREYPLSLPSTLILSNLGVPPDKTRWLETGCGASALLTRFVLDSRPKDTHVTAFEINRNSAKRAIQILDTEFATGKTNQTTRLIKSNFESNLKTNPNHPRREKNYRIIHGASTDHTKVLARFGEHFLHSFDVILHEIFGFIASSEGCALSLNHARQHYGKFGRGLCLPSRAASFFTPTFISPRVIFLS
eukprot:TRINITY_DN5065_c0_g2_i3.p1 TRINITY_DN5065_c0_g2~~TRINITY_DN5065_c0_g2_i3.p1  ORF type:complete len:287 (+),score=23.26 TRINITY_DN5065_c0_g2_i3:58-918(+)